MRFENKKRVQREEKRTLVVSLKAYFLSCYSFITFFSFALQKMIFRA
jgi:hypothetical protein